MSWPGAPKNPPTSPSNKSSNWPGTPKSQQTPAINPPSMRFPDSLNENSTMADVADAMRTAYNGLTVHEQAFAALPAQITGQSKTAATEAVTQIISNQTVTGVSTFNATTGAIIYFPALGLVNDQLGNPLYLTQQSDAGAKIIMGDSTPVAITLNPSVIPPWFTIIGNDSSATVSLVTDSGAVINGLTSIYPGGSVMVYYDGSTFWSEGVGIATDSSFGVVMPDNVTITIDSGIISSIGGGGTVTAVSVVTANGFEGTSSGGPTPALTLNVDATHVLPVNTGAATSYLDESGNYSVPVGLGLAFRWSNIFLGG